MNPNWCRQQLIINRLHRMNMNERNPDYLQDAAICCVKTAQFTHSFASIPISNKVIQSQGVSSRFHTWHMTSSTCIWKNNEKGSRKNAFWQFPRSIFKAKEGTIAKTIQNERKRKGFKKNHLLIISKDNFQGEGRKKNQNNTETYRNETTWKETNMVRENAPGGNSQGPRTLFEAKERKMKVPKGGKTGMKK